MKNIIKNKKGISMVELVIGMLIFAIVATTVTTILASTLKSFNKANSLAEINTMFDNLSTELLSDLSTAKTVTIAESKITIETNLNTVEYDIAGGLLQKNENPVLAKEFYKDKTMDISYLDKDGASLTSGNPSAFIVRLTLLFNSGGEVSRDYAVKPLGLQVTE